MSKITILHTNPFYENYLNGFYNKRPHLKSASYDEQYNEIMSDCFALADFWKKNLEKTGKFQGIEVISNWPVIQKKWAKEHDINFSEDTWAVDILIAQIEYYKPNIVFIRDLNMIPTQFATKIKNDYGFVKLVIGWDGVAKNNPTLFEGFDIILSCLPDVVNFYKDNGFKSYFVQHGFESSILEKLNNKEKDIDCSFVGSVGIGGKHKNRLGLLSYLSKNINIDMYISPLPSLVNIVKINLKCLMKLDFKNFLSWKDISDILYLKSKAKPPVFGLEMYDILQRSKITLNMHLEKAGNSAANMRLFEATGVGTCLLTDMKENLSEYFEIDKEIITYRNQEECLEKINFLLKNQEFTDSVARAGKSKTLNQFSLERIIGEFSEFLIDKVVY